MVDQKALQLHMNQAILENIFETYLERGRQANKTEEKVDSSNSTALSSGDGVDAAVCGSSSDAGTVATTTAACITEGCKRKRKVDCINEMCLRCCYALKSVHCEGHLVMKQKRAVEDRFIMEGLESLRNKSKKIKTSFYHYEDRFMRCGQTVVIWCMRDFLQNDKWSGDVISQQIAQRERRKRSEKKRAPLQSNVRQRQRRTGNYKICIRNRMVLRKQEWEKKLGIVS